MSLSSEGVLLMNVTTPMVCQDPLENLLQGGLPLEPRKQILQHLLWSRGRDTAERR